MGRADDGAHGGQTVLANEVGTPLRHELGDLLPDVPAVRKHEVLDLCAARIRRLHDAEQAGAVAPAGGQERIERVAAQIRVDRDRIRERLAALAALEIRLGVRARSRADVTSLRVGNDLQTGGARVRTDVLQRTHTVGAERLEERDLRLDRDDVRRHRVDDPAAETRARIRRLRTTDMGFAAQLDRKLIGPWVEPDDELRALVLDGLGEAVGEVRRSAGRRAARGLGSKDSDVRSVGGLRSKTLMLTVYLAGSADARRLELAPRSELR